MATLRNDTVIRSADGQGTSAIVTASNIGSYGVATNSTYYVGTTQNIFNRASGAQTLTGVSIDGNAATVTNGLTTGNYNSYALPLAGGTLTGNLTITKASAYLYLNGTNSDSELRFLANSSDRWAMGMNVGDATENLNIYNYTTATTNFTILKASGNVGVGTASPSYKLDVSGAINASTYVYAGVFYDNDNTVYYTNPSGTSNLVGLTVANTITGSVSGNAATATNVAWTGITGGARTNYLLEFQPPANSYAGFAFKTSAAGEAGYFLVKGTADGDVYTAEGITLVADAGWLTLAQRTTASRGVKIMTGTTSLDRFKITTAGDVQIVNGNTFTYNSNVVLHAGNYGGYSTFSGSVTSTYGNFTTPGLIIGDAQYGFYVVSGNVYYKSASGGVHYWRNTANSGNTMSLDNSGNLNVSGYLQTTGNLIYPSTYGVTQRLEVSNAANNAWIDGLTIAPGGIVTAYGDSRAPIFYDSANTAYYCDPNGVSNLYGVAIRGDVAGANTDNQIFFWGTGNGTTSAIGFKSNSGVFTNPTGNGDGYNTYLTMDTDGRGWVFRRGVGGTDFTSAYTAGWILNNGIWQANASMRAPIFYDSNNTAYYLDPASTSNLYYIIMPHIANGSPNLVVNNGASENWNAIKINGGNDNNGIGFSNTSHSAFARNNLSFHTHNLDSIRFHSSGWDTLFEVAGSSGNAWLKGGSFDSSFTRLVNPGGAYYVTGTSTITGAIKIRLPRLKVDTMMRMTVKIYQYNTGQSATIECGGYDYSGDGVWRNIFAYQNSDLFATVNVRFGNDGTYDCVWIGETSSTWSYPQVFVTDFQAGYNNYTSAWGTGWNISYVTAFDTVTDTRVAYKTLNASNYNSYAPTLTGTGASGTWAISVTGNAGGSSASCTGNAATATILQTARNINGTSFNGSAAITTATWGTARTLTIGSTGKSVDGSAAVSWSLAELGAAATNQTMFIGTTSVAINRGSASQTLTGVNIDGNSGGIYAAGGAYIQTTSTGTSYGSHIQVREAAGGGGLTSEIYAPALGFHWSGVVASNILMESSGRMSIRDNPGTGYENFIANIVYGNASVRSPIFYDSNDTAYYCDPAGESKLNYLRLTNSNALYFTTTSVAELNNEGNSTNVAFRMIKSGSSNSDGNNYGVLNLQRTNHTNGATNAGGSIFFELKDSGGTIREYAGISGCKTEAGAAGGRLIFHRYARTEVGYWDADQLYSSSSVRSPIFYDSNDTGYYLNPAGSSQVVSIYANDWFRAQGNTGLYFQDKGYGITSAGGASNSYGNASTYGTGLNGWQGWGIGSRHCMMSTGADNFGVHDNTRGSWLYYWNGTYHNFQYGYLESASSVRAPLFYDSNNTTYYVDPASTGYSAYFAGAIQATKIGIEDAGLDCYMEITDANPTVYGVGYGGEFIFYGDKSTPASFLYYGGATVTYTLQANSSLRSPIFYDSNDTGYYLDPASNSVLNGLYVNAYYNLSNDYKDIYVYGDVNTYYVVLIQGEYIYSFGRYSVTRGYNWTGPDTWNTASHKGGLTLDWEWSGDTAWGGNDKAIRIIEFNESYSTMVAGLGYPVNGGVIIWLRGGGVGGAQYRIRTPIGSNTTVTAYDGVSATNHSSSTTFTAANSAVFSSRADVSNVSAEILARYPVRNAASLYNDGNLVVDTGSSTQTKSGIFASAASVRAPIFYDTDNTGYYVDPNSTSNLVGLTVANTITGSISGNSGTVGGLSVHSGRNNEANKVVRTDSNGYIQAGWINTTSGDNGTSAIDRVYASGDGYIRYYTPANFRTVLDVPTRGGSGASGSWGISVTGSSASCTGNSVTATSATFLNASNYIQRIGGSGNYNTDFQNTPAGSVRHQGDDATSTNNPGGTWWFVDNYKHSNSSSHWGTQVAWGWEDNANRLATRNVIGGSFGGWVYYLNSANYTSYAIARGGDTLDGVTLFRSNKGATSTVGANNTYGLQAYSSDAGAAGMSFHRGGHYAINMGLDPDNVFRIGGWSASSNRLQLDTGGNLTVATNMYANGFYDNNNTALYCDPNGTSLFTGLTVTNTITGSISGSSASCTGNSATTTLATKATRANGNFYIDDNYGNTVVGVYSASRYQGVYAMGDSYKLAADGSTTGSLYGIAWSHPNAGGAAGNLSNHGALILLNGGYAAAISSSIRCTVDMRTPIYYDSDNTSYYIDAGSTSYLYVLSVASAATAADYYTAGWFRSSTSGNGMYNQVTGQHFYSDSANYWNVASSASEQGIRLRTGGHAGTVRGYFYADTNNDVGLLNQAGSWRVRVVGGDYVLFDGSSIRAQIFYDSNDTGYYIDAASTSILNVVRANSYVQKSASQSLSGTVGCTIDVAAAGIHVLTLAASTTISSFTYNYRAPNPSVNTIMLVIKYGGTASITWTNVLWANGVTPTITGVSGYADVYMLTSYQGTTGVWIGTVVSQGVVSTSL